MIVVPLLLVAAFEVDVAVDLTTTMSLVATTFLLQLEVPELGGSSPCGGPCDPRTVNSMDRWVIEYESPLARTMSDVVGAAMLVLPLVSIFEYPEDSLIAGQALAATLLVTQTLKIMIQRPRPLAYNPSFPEEERFEGDARLSMPSGHTSITFASATAFAVPWFTRHNGLLSFAGVAAAYSAASFVAVMRILGGKHFITDVLAGAAIGIGVGLVVTLAHQVADPGETAALDPVQNSRGLAPMTFGFGGGF
jgi:hypothetical protein